MFALDLLFHVLAQARDLVLPRRRRGLSDRRLGRERGNIAERDVAHGPSRVDGRSRQRDAKDDAISEQDLVAVR